MSNSDLFRQTARGVVGLLRGGLGACVRGCFLLVGLPMLVVPAARGSVYACARQFAEADRRRVSRYFRDTGEAAEYGGPRALRYVAVRAVLGMFGVGILLLILWGTATVVVLAWQMLSGWSIGGEPVEPMDWTDPVVVAGGGALMLFVAVWGLIGVAMMEVLATRHFLGPSEQDLLRRRVTELAASRAGVVEAVNQERRRIERDLHDGVQQRLVALGMLLGRARRAGDPERVSELIRLAHEEAQQTLSDLREVSWRVYPIALDEGGLPPALETVAERSSVPVRLDVYLGERLDLAIETVAYFARRGGPRGRRRGGRSPGCGRAQVSRASSAFRRLVR